MAFEKLDFWATNEQHHFSILSDSTSNDLPRERTCNNQNDSIATHATIND